MKSNLTLKQKILRIFLIIVSFLSLTILTQIGGIIYLLNVFLIKKYWKKSFRFQYHLSFLTLYLFTICFVVPPLAKLFGREPIQHTERIHPTNYLTVLLNRNYVKPKMNELLKETEDRLDKLNSDVQIHYLDASFPFIDRFPLIPHLSHSDGKKLDLSFIYEDKNGNITNKQKSISGYGVCESPKPNEVNYTSTCKNKGYWQYDYNQFLTFGSINDDLTFSEKGTKQLIEILLANPKLKKMFVEPHLKNRMNIQNSKIRHQGCKSVSHDDHIHIQL